MQMDFRLSRHNAFVLGTLLSHSARCHFIKIYTFIDDVTYRVNGGSGTGSNSLNLSYTKDKKLSIEMIKSMNSTPHTNFRRENQIGPVDS